MKKRGRLGELFCALGSNFVASGVSDVLCVFHILTQTLGFLFVHQVHLALRLRTQEHSLEGVVESRVGREHPGSGIVQRFFECFLGGLVSVWLMAINSVLLEIDGPFLSV